MQKNLKPESHRSSVLTGIVIYFLITATACGGSSGSASSNSVESGTTEEGVEAVEGEGLEIRAILTLPSYNDGDSAKSVSALNKDYSSLNLAPTPGCICHLYSPEGGVALGPELSDLNGVCRFFLDDSEVAQSSEGLFVMSTCEGLPVECYRDLEAEGMDSMIDFGTCDAETTLVVETIKASLGIEDFGEVDGGLIEGVSVSWLHEFYESVWDVADSSQDGTSSRPRDLIECWQEFVAAGGTPDDMNMVDAEELIHSTIMGELSSDQADQFEAVTNESGRLSDGFCREALGEAATTVRSIVDLTTDSAGELSDIFKGGKIRDLAKTLVVAEEPALFSDRRFTEGLKSFFDAAEQNGDEIVYGKVEAIVKDQINSVQRIEPKEKTKKKVEESAKVSTKESSRVEPIEAKITVTQPAEKEQALVAVESEEPAHQEQTPASSDDNDTVSPERSSPSLDECTASPVFTHPPVALSNISSESGITSLGNLGPSAHTFPTYHVYFMIKDSDGSQTAPVDEVPVYAPGEVMVTSVVSVEYLTTGVTDYMVAFSPCQQIQGYYDHLSSLSSTLKAAFDQGQGSCRTYDPGDGLVRRCDKGVSVKMQAGDVVGTAGGTKTKSVALDFGVRDGRMNPLAYANPNRIFADKDSGFDLLHVACPLDYYSSDLKGQLESKLDRVANQGPLCGTVNQDVAMTSQGKWYLEGTASPTNEEGQGIALVHDNRDPRKPVLSIGNANLGTRTYYYSPHSAGNVNRDFDDITSDGNTYCFDSLTDRFGNPDTDTIFFLRMTDVTHLTIERRTQGGCGSGPWEFTDGALDFVR